MFDLIYSILIIILGIFLYLKPQIAWKIKHFFDTDGGEPKNYFISFTKGVGAIAIGVGIVIFFILVL